MADSSIVAAIESYESLSETHGELSEERSELLDYYLGNPLGNEIEGRSQVVSRDVWDTVEWIKPQLADIFCGGDEVVNFSPRGPEDVQGAEQETDFVNHVITEKNSWFELFYGWSHDALLQKVGYVKAYWDESEDRTKERYEGLTDDELPLLLQQDDEVEPVESERTENGWNITLQRTKRYGCVRLVNVAPENVRVDSNARNLNLQDPSCNFSQHCEHKTITQLRDEGFDVDDDLSDAGSAATTFEDENRLESSSLRSDGEENTDPSMRKVLVRECWIRYDEDGDGRAEMRHVIIVGTTVLLNEEADSSLLVALCPTPLPHQHTGLAVADAVKDLQLIKTALLRGSLDNQYLANNGRHAVDQNSVNLDDMLVSRPGGIVRVNGKPGESIFPLTHSTTGDAAVGMMEYMDRIAQKRTGVNEQSQGLDPNVLQTATHSAMIATAAQQRIKFIARIFAETGVKSLFLLVHALTLKHGRKAEMVKLRNRWVPVDPRQWVKRSDMQIAAGLGAGDKAQQIVFLEGVLAKQTVALQAGLTSPPKIYNALKRLTHAGGFKDAGEFWDDPSTKPPAPPQPNPEVLKEQAKAQAAMQIEQIKAQSTAQIEERRSQLKLAELRANLELQATNDMRDAEREQRQAAIKNDIERQKIEFEQWKAGQEQMMAKYKTDQDNMVKLRIAGMQEEAARAEIEGPPEPVEEPQEPQTDPVVIEALTEVGRALQASMAAQQQLAQLMQQLAQGQQQLEQTMRRSKRVVRGPDGKIAGVEVV